MTGRCYFVYLALEPSRGTPVFCRQCKYLGLRNAASAQYRMDLQKCFHRFSATAGACNLYQIVPAEAGLPQGRAVRLQRLQGWCTTDVGCDLDQVGRAEAGLPQGRARVQQQDRKSVV